MEIKVWFNGQLLMRSTQNCLEETACGFGAKGGCGMFPFLFLAIFSAGTQWAENLNKYH